MIDQPLHLQTQHWRRSVIFGLVVLVVIGSGFQWWVLRPKRSAEHFVALVSKQQITTAAAMLADSTSIRSEADGTLRISGMDGTSAVLTPGELPLIALGVTGAQTGSGTSDYLGGRYRFSLASAGSDTANGSRAMTEVHCVSLDGRVVVESVKQ
jgi:hypothetical protein